MQKVKLIESTEKEYTIYSCIKCGSDDIVIYNCGYSSQNCAGGKCKKCGNKVETGRDWNEKDSVLIEIWNKNNNPSIAIENLLKQKNEILLQIKELRKKELKLKKLL